MFNFLQFSPKFFQFILSNPDPNKVPVSQLGDGSLKPLGICTFPLHILFYAPAFLVFLLKGRGPLGCKIALIAALWSRSLWSSVLCVPLNWSRPLEARWVSGLMFWWHSGFTGAGVYFCQEAYLWSWTRACREKEISLLSHPPVFLPRGNNHGQSWIGLSRCLDVLISVTCCIHRILNKYFRDLLILLTCKSAWFFLRTVS